MAAEACFQVFSPWDRYRIKRSPKVSPAEMYSVSYLSWTCVTLLTPEAE